MTEFVNNQIGMGCVVLDPPTGDNRIHHRLSLDPSDLHPRKVQQEGSEYLKFRHSVEYANSPLSTTVSTSFSVSRIFRSRKFQPMLVQTNSDCEEEGVMTLSIPSALNRKWFRRYDCEVYDR